MNEIERWLQHHDKCQIRVDVGHERACDCGLAAALAQQPQPARTFPVNYSGARERNGPLTVPWTWIEKYAGQVVVNHDQSLERLAERGGLGPSEIWAVVQGKSVSDFMNGRWPSTTECLAWLRSEPWVAQSPPARGEDRRSYTDDHVQAICDHYEAEVAQFREEIEKLTGALGVSRGGEHHTAKVYERDIARLREEIATRTKEGEVLLDGAAKLREENRVLVDQARRLRNDLDNRQDAYLELEQRNAALVAAMEKMQDAAECLKRATGMQEYLGRVNELSDILTSDAVCALLAAEPGA